MCLALCIGIAGYVYVKVEQQIEKAFPQMCQNKNKSLIDGSQLAEDRMLIYAGLADPSGFFSKQWQVHVFN